MRWNLKGTAAVLAVGMSNGLHVPDVRASEGETLETVLITAKRADRISKGATGLDLEIKDTPQSISVVTRDQMEDFGASTTPPRSALNTGVRSIRRIPPSANCPRFLMPAMPLPSLRAPQRQQPVR